VGPRNISQYLVVLAMMLAERRRAPRAKWLTDINFEPSNGGIVLNVSEGGLCFHSIAPIQRTTPIRFSLSLHNQRIHAAGELAWIDETEKTGGLRFTILPAEVREEIRNWTGQPATQVALGGASPSPIPSLRAFPATDFVRPAIKASDSAPTVVVSPRLKGPARLSEFSSGLGIGLFVSALVTAAFLFHSYRGQVGESIIQLGQRVAAKPQDQGETAPPMAQAVLQESRAISPPRTQTSFSQSEALRPQPPAKPQEAKPASAQPTITLPTPAGGPGPRLPAAADREMISSTPPLTSLPPIVVESNSYLIPGKLGPAPPLGPANSTGVHVDVSEKANVSDTSQMYFEVGKFKDQILADGSTDKLAQLGFHATVVQKGGVWRNSYYVLVGPYEDDREAKIARQSLVSRGFKPRPFERGSRDFTLSSGLTINNMRMPVGDCTIRWESYSSNVVVQFVQENNIVATADGNWVKRDVRYDRGAIAYTKNRDGSRNLLEIRFAGMSRALIFGKSS
jgi:hypothetical protein